jgi:hypothetical protein
MEPPQRRDSSLLAAACRVLESRGLEVVLAYAREASAVPGKKSDINGAMAGAIACVRS